MASISEINQNTATQNTTSKSATSKALGQDQFLTLLVAQLQNQDPLNPSDPTEFTSQLAQYSQLEQLFNLNDAMGELTTAQSNSQRINALSLIGQDVVVENDQFTLGSDPVQLGYKVEGSPTSVKLQIKNSDGKLVNTLSASELSTGDHFLTWNGKDAAGNTLAAGSYTITIDAKKADGTTATISPLVRSQVNGIDLSATEPKIVTPVGSFNISALHGAFTAKNGTSGSS